jgi:hypothetical protein
MDFVFTNFDTKKPMQSVAASAGQNRMTLWASSGLNQSSPAGMGDKQQN